MEMRDPKLHQRQERVEHSLLLILSEKASWRVFVVESRHRN